MVIIEVRETSDKKIRWSSFLSRKRQQKAASKKCSYYEPQTHHEPNRTGSKAMEQQTHSHVRFNSHEISQLMPLWLFHVLSGRRHGQRQD